MAKTTILTDKQMAFCEEYVKNGGNGVKAYMAAYQNNMSDPAARVEACRMLDMPKIQEQITRLRKPVEKAVVRRIINERDYKKQLIQERIQLCVERDDDSAIARYLEIWNKMDGEYVNINKDITDKAADIQNLDLATLQQLAQATEMTN